MKTQLRLCPHTQLDGACVIELWREGELIGSITGADKGGVRVFTKHPIAIDTIEIGIVNIVEISIQAGTVAEANERKKPVIILKEPNAT